ncbi:MAG: hypothetical protein C5B55_11100 [Blastocatellia bacterium]|nr:MAG: hypothetical protein C5B55_11100 [Blastocatellia bacterium]
MCRALMSRGHEVTIATTRHGLSDVNGHAKRMYKGILTHFFPVQWGEGFKYSRPFKTWLDRNVQSFDVVHIHAVFNYSSIAASKSCRKSRVPYVVRPLGTLDPWSMKQKSFRKSLFFTLAGKRMLQSAGTVHYTAQGEFDRVKHSLGLTQGTVVPLGIEDESKSITDIVLGAQASSPARLPLRVERETHEARTPALPAPPYILFLSRLHPKKGLELLIKAFVALHKNQIFSEWHLVIAGDGDRDYVDSLKRLVSLNSGDETIHFVGWLSGDQKPEVLRKASLLVLPSRQENFGLCVLEALAEEVPVVVSSEVNLAKEIADAGAGWISKVDVASLVKTLSEAMIDREQRLRRGSAGKAFSQNFTWESIAEKLENMYVSIVERNG